MHHASRAPPTSSERYHQLRALTVLVFPLSFSLLLSCGLDEYEPLPAIGIAPMALSAVLGALAFRGIAPGHEGFAGYLRRGVLDVGSCA